MYFWQTLLKENKADPSAGPPVAAPVAAANQPQGDGSQQQQQTGNPWHGNSMQQFPQMQHHPNNMPQQTNMRMQLNQQQVSKVFAVKKSTIFNLTREIFSYYWPIKRNWFWNYHGKFEPYFGRIELKKKTEELCRLIYLTLIAFKCINKRKTKGTSFSGVSEITLYWVWRFPKSTK